MTAARPISTASTARAGAAAAAAAASTTKLFDALPRPPFPSVPRFTASPTAVLDAIARDSVNPFLQTWRMKPRSSGDGCPAAEGWHTFLSPHSIVIRLHDWADRTFAFKVFLSDQTLLGAFVGAVALATPQVQAEPWAGRFCQSSNLDQAVQLADGVWLPGVLMEWVGGVTLDQFVRANRRRLADRVRLVLLAGELRVTLAGFSRSGFVHGDLCARNLIVRLGTDWVTPVPMFIDTASLSWTGWTDSLRTVAGQSAFQPAGRFAAPAAYAAAWRGIDTVSALILYVSLAAYAIAETTTFPDPPSDGERLLFSVKDLARPADSATFASLHALFVDADAAALSDLLSELQRLLGAPPGEIPAPFEAFHDSLAEVERRLIDGLSALSQSHFREATSP